MNMTIEGYFAEGCGRCPLGGTPNCKVHNWPKELELLRNIVLECGLTEEVKWGVPCYTFQQNNVLIVALLKNIVRSVFLKEPCCKMN